MQKLKLISTMINTCFINLIDLIDLIDLSCINMA